jgi:hypothetical protein
MKKFFILLIPLIVISLSGCKKQANNWVGFYYPEGAPSFGEANCEINEFEIKNECEGWASEKLKNNSESEYYCGYRCTYDSSCQYACQNK